MTHLLAYILATPQPYSMTAALVVSVVAIEVNTVINTCKILDQIVLFFCSIAT